MIFQFRSIRRSEKRSVNQQMSILMVISLTSVSASIISGPKKGVVHSELIDSAAFLSGLSKECSI